MKQLGWLVLAIAAGGCTEEMVRVTGQWQLERDGRAVTCDTGAEYRIDLVRIDVFEGSEAIERHDYVCETGRFSIDLPPGSYDLRLEAGQEWFEFWDFEGEGEVSVDVDGSEGGQVYLGDITIHLTD